MLRAGYSILEDGIIQYQMGYGADEFGKVLNGTFSGEKSDYRCEPVSSCHWRITQIDNPLQITIQVSEQPPRRLGLFAIPVLRVEFNLHDSDPDLQAKFFERFFKYFHKGGG